MVPTDTVNFMFLVFSRISLLFTFFYLILTYFSQITGKNAFLVTIQKSTLFCYIIAVILGISRFFLNLSASNFKFFAVCSTIILISFSTLRINIVCGYTTTNVFLLFWIFVALVICSINSLLRLVIFLGYNIDISLQKGYVFVWSETVQKILSAAKSGGKYVIERSNPAGSNNQELLKRYGLFAAIVTVPIMAVATYDNRLTRIATQQGAEAAQKAADATCVSAGLMTKEDFVTKWSKK